MTRVPVEHRFFGLDRRTIPFAAAAAAIWLLWTVILPQVNDRVAWTDTIRAGERVRLADDVTFAPPAGWGLESGLRTTDMTASGVKATQSVELSNHGVIVSSQQGPWDGTPRQLLDQIARLNTTSAGKQGFDLSSRPVTIHTASGEDGVLQGFHTSRVEGLTAAFVFDGVGIKLQIAGAPDQLQQQVQDIGRMLASVRREGTGQ